LFFQIAFFLYRLGGSLIPQGWGSQPDSRGNGRRAQNGELDKESAGWVNPSDFEVPIP